jgi:hypothetical protein
MENRMNRNDIAFGTAQEFEVQDRHFWAHASYEEKLMTITYLRECFYGKEATTGRLQRIYQFFKQK